MRLGDWILCLSMGLEHFWTTPPARTPQGRGVIGNETYVYGRRRWAPMLHMWATNDIWGPTHPVTHAA